MAEEKQSINKAAVITVTLLVLLSLGAAMYFWNEARQARNESPEAVAERNLEESNEVIQALDEVLLTESERAPTVARIDDAETLKEANPDFYKNAQDGDYLIIYSNRAVIFREAESKIINVAPIVNPSAVEGQAEEGTE